MFDVPPPLLSQGLDAYIGDMGDVFLVGERPVAFDFHDVRDELISLEADFRVGGRDVFRCGPKVDLKCRAETNYFLIVPNVCVVSSEALDMNG
jgi:hypothetical protein